MPEMMSPPQHGACAAFGAEPRSYLADTLRVLLDGHPKSRIDELMPWNFTTASSLVAYPKTGESMNAVALVWSKAPVIVGAQDTGPLIRSRDGFWLAIPTKVAGRCLRGAKITPRRMGASPWPPPALCLPPARPEPAGSGPRPHQHPQSGGGLALEKGSQPGHRADLYAGPAGQAETAGPRPRRRAIARQRAGLIVANWVEGKL